MSSCSYTPLLSVNASIIDASCLEITAYAHDVFKALLVAVEDYSVDDRGDVGSWVREAAVVSLEKWASRMMAVSHRSDSSAPLLGPELAQVCWAHEFSSQVSDMPSSYMWRQQFMSKLLGQMADKLDKTRLNAGQVFERVLHTTSIPSIPHKEDIVTAFPK